ncbi:MAG: phosphoenolpyruvate synthase [Propionibacteriaceae bacterium]|nr:phosphoenolpyruvate synthase [Propionibacteriaceae bacterium]
MGSTSFSLDDISLAAHGGKGANLARLTLAGFDVPAWFIISTDHYRDYVTSNALEPTITTALAGLDGTDPGALESASATIRDAFTAGRWPETTWATVLGPAAEWASTPLAVRSSATAEDLAEASFAGQQDTSLNVIGEAALRAAVVACFASLWTARAIGYRVRNGIDQATVALAVVVQVMVPAEASGVLFTANPLTGVRGESVIDATVGLGEALVSGQVEPDHWVIDSATGRILERRTGAKQAATVPLPSGGVRLVASEAGQGLCLSDAQVVEIARLGTRVARLFGSPQDIEWAVAEGRVQVLQSRAITTLFPLPAFTPTDRSPLGVWFSFGAVQGILDPLTPLGQDAIRVAFAGAARLFGRQVDPVSNPFVRAAGERLWIRLDLVARSPLGRKVLPVTLPMVEPSTARILEELRDDPRWAPLPGHPWSALLGPFGQFLLRVLPRLPRSVLDPVGQRHAFEAAAEGYLSGVRHTESQASAISDPPARLAARLDGLREQIGAALQILLPRFAPIMGPGIAMTSRLNDLAAAAGEPSLGLECLRGLDGNVTTAMGLTLWRAARTIQADPPSLARFIDDDPDTLAAAYRAGTLPPVAQAAVGSFLAAYGMRGLAELDLGRPRWDEDPSQVLATLRSYVRIEPAQAPDVAFVAAQRASGLAIERLAGLLPRPQARQARFLASRIRGLMGARETPKFTVIKAMGMVRNGLLESGADLVAAGVLERADDVCFLRLAELDRVWTQDAAHWRPIITARRRLDDRETRRAQVPRVILSDGRTFYEGLADAADGALAGSPVSPGVAEGRVRVVSDPASESLAPGEILVCRATDPAWTPLFLAAAGLVTEVGGMMTHGSVVAREYGIPAVVGVHDATRRLSTGQRVRLDGTHGTIEVLDDPGS